MVDSDTTGLEAWDATWERDVYARGRQLNRYPHHAVVGFVFRHYGQVADRAQIKLLEVGCGAGNNLWFAAREGFSVAGIDGSVTAVEFARRRLLDDGLVGDLRVGSFDDLPWADESFDAIIDRNALTHARRRVIAKAIAEARRVLKTGGRLLSIMYSHDHPSRQQGRNLGDDTYVIGAGAYFSDVGITHFATAEDVQELFGVQLTIRSSVHTVEEDVAGGRPVNAHWRIECEKTA